MDVIHWMVWDSSDEELWNNPTFWITLILAVGYGMWNIYDSTIYILVQLHHSPALLSFPCNCLPAVPLTFWLTSGSSEVTDVVTEDAQVCGDKLKGRSGEEAQYVPQWLVLVCSSSLCCRRTGCAAGPHTKAPGVSLHPLSKKSTFIWRLLLSIIHTWYLTRMPRIMSV